MIRRAAVAWARALGSAWLAAWLAGCGGAARGAADGGPDAGPPDPILGWVLLQADPQTLERNLDAAERYGVTHLQFSHDWIMSADDVLGDEPDAAARREALRAASDEADRRGFATAFWAHELTGAGPLVCYAPDDPLWIERAQTYRDLFAAIGSLDGAVLQFGSSDMPPWFTLCTCDWCAENYPGADPFLAPPNDERITLITERLGSVIVGELGRDLVARTFVHEPAEDAWHADGFAAVEGFDFLGMHKSEVQDWQPYNPPDPTLGQEGDHHSLLEMDVAGEYYGLSVLPFCAPDYFAWRLAYGHAHGVIGTAVRIERGSYSALGSPNEVNLRAIADRIFDPDAPIQASWDAFLGEAYGLQPGDDGHPLLQRILSDTFAVRLESHYVLGIWALEKGSDLPASADLDQFDDRGDLPKFDPDWQPIWDALDKPDRQVVLWVWQEGSEAVDLAESDLAELEGLQAALGQDELADLFRRLSHQAYAAEAWRAVKLFIWAERALPRVADQAELYGWMAWAQAELARVADEMEAAGLGDVPLASPGRIRAFMAATADRVPAGTAPDAPPEPLFSPLRTVQLNPTTADVVFRLNRQASVSAEWGQDLPDFGSRRELGVLAPDQDHSLELTGLEPGRRIVVRLSADLDGTVWRSGVHWIFTP